MAQGRAENDNKIRFSPEQRELYNSVKYSKLKSGINKD